MLPHVDRFLPVHNLDSLQALVQVMADGGDGTGRHERPDRVAPRSSRR
jgi:hypothetical protein